MLMEWYIALFTCKTTTHCVFYIKCITCRHYLGVGTGGGGGGGGGRGGYRGHVPLKFSVSAMFALCIQQKLNSAPQSTSPLYLT